MKERDGERDTQRERERECELGELGESEEWVERDRERKKLGVWGERKKVDGRSEIEGKYKKGVGGERESSLEGGC